MIITQGLGSGLLLTLGYGTAVVAPYEAPDYTPVEYVQRVDQFTADHSLITKAPKAYSRPVVDDFVPRDTSEITGTHSLITKEKRFSKRSEFTKRDDFSTE